MKVDNFSKISLELIITTLEALVIKLQELIKY